MEKMNFAQMVQVVGTIWSTESKYTDFMPSREMYCPLLNGFDECDCLDNPELDDIQLNMNTDWLLWEIELIED